MSLIQNTLKDFFDQYPESPIVVAYSGGVDSQVLLHALAQLQQTTRLKNQLSVCHVNHGISQNAAQWQHSAEQFCQQLSLPLTVCEVHVKALAQHSLEALARDARYQALHETSPFNALIVTGHHSDDQSETFLLALKRGAGLKGLSAMAKISNFSPTAKPSVNLCADLAIDNSSSIANKYSNSNSNQLLVRPLLNIARAEIDRYAQDHKLTWIEDESNEDIHYDRNFIRHQIMPILSQRWPSILRTINRSSELCREGQTLLTELAQQDLDECQLSKTSLGIDKLLLLSQARFNNLLRYFLDKHQCLMPSKQQLQQVYQQLFATIDKSPEIKVADHWLRRYKNALYLTFDYQDVSDWIKIYQGHDLLMAKQTIYLPDNLGQVTFESEQQARLIAIDNVDLHVVLAPLASQTVTLRFNHDNPRCTPDFRQHSRPLKKVLQELQIAPWLRNRLPYLYYDDCLVAVIGYFVCKDFIPREEQDKMTISWLTQ